jgi:hypothetical protein
MKLDSGETERGGGDMRAVVVYESMYGNTHLVADAIATGLATACQVDVVPVERADRQVLDGADLVVVGGPTHAHGMTRASTREAAIARRAPPRQHTGPGARRRRTRACGSGSTRYRHCTSPRRRSTPASICPPF